MKANELRIGNWLNLHGYKEVAPRPIDSEDIDRVDWDDQDEWQPIPITEEILLKLGFEKGEPIIMEERNYTKFFLPLMYNRSSVKIEYTMTKGAVWYCFLGEQLVPANFVHQLQNLYFAVTGTELNVDL